MGLGYYGDSVDALENIVIGRNYRTVSATKIADCLSRVEYLLGHMVLLFQ